MLDRFAIDFSLCMYCGICIEVCPFDALHWSPEFEYAELDIRDLLHEKDRLGQWMPTVPPPPALDEHAAEPAEIGQPPGRLAARRRTAEPPARPATARASPPDPHGQEPRRPTGAARARASDGTATWPSPRSALIAAASGLLAVTTRHVVHAALWLVVCLGAVAGCYLVLGAEFVALVQLLVYVGAIVVLVLFALMLTRAPIGPNREISTSRLHRVLAAVLGPASTALLAAALLPIAGPAVERHDTSTDPGRGSSSSAPGCGPSRCCRCCCSSR